MASTKMFVHYPGTVDAFKALSNIADYEKKIVFIKGGADGKGAAIYTHGEYYTSAHDVEALVGSLKAISGVMVNSDRSTLKVAQTHDGVLNFCADGETVAVTMDGPGITISVSEAFRNRVTALETSLGIPVTNENGKANGTAYERIAKLASDVAALGGESGSIASQINAAIGQLNVTDTAVTGEYVSAVSEAGGKISVSRLPLPTYTLAEGATNGTVKFNNVEVKVHGLGSAAYTDAAAYDAAGAAGAVDSKLITHVENTVVHITDAERKKWDDTKAAVDIFLGDNLGKDAQDVIDTLKDIQGYITNDGAAADALVKRVAALEGINHDAYVGADEVVLSTAKSYADSLVKGADGKSLFDAAGSASAAKEAAIAHANGLVLDKDGNAKFEAVGVAAGLVDGLAKGAVKTNTEAIAVINGDGEGSIAKAKADAITYAELLFAWEEL